MQSSRRDVLVYRSTNVQNANNTLLHDLILSNSIDSAKHVIAQDMTANDGITIINHRSLENTPLMLALKTGAIEIALAILDHGKVDVHQTDCRGLTALHWACMLRQDAVISRLLDKGANPHHVTKGWNYHFAIYDKVTPLTPFNLYLDTADVTLMSQYAMACYRALDLNADGWHTFEDRYPNYFHCFYRHDTRSQNTYFIPPFCDREELYIPGLPAYTDIIFHMRELCTNLKWVFPTTEFVTDETTHRTMTTFKHNFMEGLFAFCKFRNDIQVNPMILQQMTIPPVTASDIQSPFERLTLDEMNQGSASRAAGSPQDKDSQRPTRV